MTNDTPMRIYVASLSDYNAGNLLGTWIDVEGLDPSEIQAEVDKMLATSKEEPHEEWAIHDHEGFEGYSISEWESFERIALFGDVKARLDDGVPMRAFFGWLGNGHFDLDDYGDDPDGLAEKFREQYRGQWDTFKEYVTDGDAGDMHLGISELKAAMEQYDKDNSWRYSGTPHSDLFEKLTYVIDWDMVARDLEQYYTVDRVPGDGVHIYDLEA